MSDAAAKLALPLGISQPTLHCGSADYAREGERTKTTIPFRSGNVRLMPWDWPRLWRSAICIVQVCAAAVAEMIKGREGG